MTLNILEQKIDIDENGIFTDGYRVSEQVVDSDMAYVVAYLFI